jgi:thiamine-phosphate pyrophosphorylase
MPIEKARKLLGEDKIICLSVNDREEAVLVEKLGTDYVGLGPIFDTATKKDAGKGIGSFKIREVKDTIKLPVVAISGINKENCESVIQNGADSLVAISAVVYSDDVKRETKYFIDMIRRIKKHEKE